MDDRTLVALAAAAYAATPTWMRGDVHACASSSPASGVTAIAFRGSQTIEDWLRDLAALPFDDPELGPCHTGFLSGVTGVEAQMVEDLAGKSVILTGHSLGGALALIFGARLVVRGAPPRSIVTFGAPRAGFAKLRSILTAVPELRQYQHCGDIVPDLPAWPYLPAQQPIRIGRSSRDPIEDHAIAQYAAALVSVPAV